MTLHDLWVVLSPQSFIFFRQKNGVLKEYAGGKKYSDAVVGEIHPTSYPMFKNVLEVTLAKGGDAD
jgi:hypothetical protein